MAVLTTPEGYPEKPDYKSQTRTLHVGLGEFALASPEVWDLSVSGLQVLRSWLGYRMRERAGRASSELDAIRPERWTTEFTRELLELLWVLEVTVAVWPELAEKLEAVVGGDVFLASDFPMPTDAERKPPETEKEDTQLPLGL